MENQNIEYQGLSQQVEASGKKHSFRMGILVGVLLGVILSIIIASICILPKFHSKSATSVQEILKGDDSKLSYIISIIGNYYYKDVEDEKLVEGVYKGVVSSLDDPYSAYYNEKEYEDLMLSLTGDYAGVGALLSKDKDTGVVTVNKTYPNTPAEKAGLVSGDIIVSADGFDALDESLDEFVQHIRGEVGTDVTLVIQRGEETFEVVCTREEVIVPTVTYEMMDNNIGYIQIDQFGSNTDEEFEEAMETLMNQGMKSVVFDLRGNGGGMLDSVVNMLDYLLPKGTVVYTLTKQGDREDFESDAEHFVDMPMTVLVDGNTASASEIFTGAIRDFEYGTIIGTKTFGKGIVQSTIPLGDGSALKLTTHTYYTPSGECIHGNGITPDIEMEYEFLGGEEVKEYSKEYDNQLLKAIEVLEDEMK